MSEHITREDRDALRELASGATSGPWMFDRDQRDGWMVVFGGSGYPHGYNIICSSEYLEPADAAFIAAARTSVPALLDALDRAEAERDQAQAALRQIPGYTTPEHFRSAVEKLIAEKAAAEARIKAAQEPAIWEVNRFNAEVEAIARVIHEHFPRKYVDEFGFTRNARWEDLEPYMQEEYRIIARTALSMARAARRDGDGER